MVKGIVNAFDHMGFCLVLNLTTTCTDGKWAVIWPPDFATKYSKIPILRPPFGLPRSGLIREVVLVSNTLS